MAPDLEKRAKEAFVDDNFELAVDLYTQALEMDPKNADLFADRAQANIKLNSFTEAVADASRAVELDPSMSKAYLRKGTACMKLEEYQTAKSALEAGASLAPGDSRFTKLIKECDERIAAKMKPEFAGDVRVVHNHVFFETSEEISSLPQTVVPLLTPASPSVESSDISTESTKDIGSDVPVQPVVLSTKPKYRHDYYNTPTEVVLTIFAKGIPADNVFVDFGEQMLSVTINAPGEEAFHFQPRLFSKIIREKSKYLVLASKVEIRLVKAEPITWTSLEFIKEKTVPQKINVSSVSKSQRPTYPSSKSKVDWDSLEAQVKKEEKDEKLEGDAALNKLFRDIYQDADEDTRRAMRKSFVESNGTVLSTNWKEVGTKKVEGTPPDGMELKKWEY